MYDFLAKFTMSLFVGIAFWAFVVGVLFAVSRLPQRLSFLLAVLLAVVTGWTLLTMLGV